MSPRRPPPATNGARGAVDAAGRGLALGCPPRRRPRHEMSAPRRIACVAAGRLRVVVARRTGGSGAGQHHRGRRRTGCGDCRQLARDEERRPRPVPPSARDAGVLRPAARPDRHRDHARRWLVCGDPCAVPGATRPLRRRAGDTVQSAGRGRERPAGAGAKFAADPAHFGQRDHRRIRSEGAGVRTAGERRCRADVPQRAQLGDGRNAGGDVPRLLRRAQAGRRARRDRPSRQSAVPPPTASRAMSPSSR